MNTHIKSICKCGHTEDLHEGLQKFESGENVPLGSGHCRNTNCDCKSYIFDKKICIKCGQEAEPSQYARAKVDDKPAVKYDENLVCRNFPDCEKSEKEEK